MFYYSHIISIAERSVKLGGNLGINLLFIVVHLSHVGINLSLNKNSEYLKII